MQVPLVPVKANESENRKNPKFLRFVASLPCAHYGNPYNVQAHHLLRDVDKSAGKKASDRYAIPLHYTLHAKIHDTEGDERAYLESLGIDDPVGMTDELFEFFLNNDRQGAEDYILNRLKLEQTL